MHNTLFIALLAGLGGMLGWGFADFFAKLTIDRIGELKSLVWAHAFGTSLFILIAVEQMTLQSKNFQMPAGVTAWIGLAAFGVLQTIVYWLVYIGFGKGLLAVLNPV